MADLMDEDVGAKYAGPYGEPGWRVFKMACRPEDGYGFDFQLTVDEGTLIPRSPLIKREQILEELNAGLYGDIMSDPKVRDDAGHSATGWHSPY
jgi:hypothetical protein